jgi:hypothetical protein
VAAIASTPGGRLSAVDSGACADRRSHRLRNYGSTRAGAQGNVSAGSKTRKLMCPRAESVCAACAYVLASVARPMGASLIVLGFAYRVRLI